MGVYDQEYKMILRSTQWVFSRLKKSLYQGEGFSLIRIGDGETRAIAHNDLISMDAIPPWLSYAGVELPDKGLKDKLLKSIRCADIIGLPFEKNYFFKPLMLEIIKKYGLAFSNICNNRINYDLYTLGYLNSLLKGRRIIIVGRKAAEAAGCFAAANLVATYDLPGMYGVDNTYREISKKRDFEIALVAAGIPAVVLCPKLARLDKIALDLGHVLDSIVTPDKSLFQLMGEWLKENNFS
ncbi:hypothetical protein GM661_01750 [Iocasia frigidifontis]|uniref:GT-D fold-like domain-containing protein n=1 Tax=Iocasia fonsfrigidae TaxID=2682810 RepID=A0A8A7K524_9FIRM|nr:GT-D fold domain-containing glycosyltransferase [Iocasia fonsfrigidae]QTL96786.1 hypothetical protein GM661_01750 [Iocasia fonsfrigidae]